MSDETLDVLISVLSDDEATTAEKINAAKAIEAIRAKRSDVGRGRLIDMSRAELQAERQAVKARIAELEAEKAGQGIVFE